MKTTSKLNNDCKNCKGWSHYYEDGPMVSNETLDNKFWVQLAINMENNKPVFNYRIFNTEIDDVIFEDKTDLLDLSNVNNKLVEMGDYYVSLSGEDYMYLLSIEVI